MECFFFEWYPDNDKEGPYGRTFVSNNTQAVETSMKEGGVRSLLPECISKQSSDRSVVDTSGCCAVKLASLLYREHASSHVDIVHSEAVSMRYKHVCAAVLLCHVNE